MQNILEAEVVPAIKNYIILGTKLRVGHYRHSIWIYDFSKNNVRSMKAMSDV